MALLSPVAAITDLLLGLTALAFGLRCLRLFRTTGLRRPLWWGLGYLALGVGSVLGFVTLGFHTGALEQPIFYVSRFSIGLAVLAMLASVTEGLAGQRRARPWLVLYLLAFAAYYVGTLRSGSFLVFILYSGGALLTTLVLESYRWLGRREPGAGWMALGMALSIGAAVLQAAGLSFTLIWTFDRNAIYHMVQLVALILLYRGVAPAEEGAGEHGRTRTESA